MSVPIQPIVLLADSQLLFWSDAGESFLMRSSWAPWKAPGSRTAA